MKRITCSGLMLALLGCIAAAQPRGEGAAPLNGGGPGSEAVNMAVVAQPSNSYVSGDTTLAALNDGSALTAIPNYARNNRDSQTQRDRGGRGARPTTSMVWLKAG